MKSRLRTVLAILILGAIASEVTSGSHGAAAQHATSLSRVGADFTGLGDRSKLFFTTGISFGF